MNSPAAKWLTKNTADTLFERLEAHGKTWKVYVGRAHAAVGHRTHSLPPTPRPPGYPLRPVQRVRGGRRGGTLPDFSLIELDMTSGHNDYHPAYGRSFIGGNLDIGFDPPSSMLGGEAFLERTTTLIGP